MKSYELKPTYENLLKTYINDSIGRDEDIFYFVDILNSLEDSCSISLEGAWGSGKTFFVKQVQMLLNAYNDNLRPEQRKDCDKIKEVWKKAHNGDDAELQQQVCVYYDAWANDNDDDPILSLVYLILNSVDTDFSFKDYSFTKAAASILDFFTGKNWVQVIENLKSKSPLECLNQSKNIAEMVKEFLDGLLSEKGNRLVVFIDELDRCKPSYAVRLLERIKHYFSNDRITFVFSTNINELQHTIRNCYGEGFDACRYLDRFFDLRVSLPLANMQKYYDTLNFTAGFEIYDIMRDTVIKTYRFQLREIARYLKFTEVVAYNAICRKNQNNIFPNTSALMFCIDYVLPIMIGLQIADVTKYNTFISGSDYTPLEIIPNCLNDYFYNSLLNHNESYTIDKIGATIVKKEHKLQHFYNAIFVNEYNDEPQIRIGKYIFTKMTRVSLLKTASLLSQNAKYDIPEDIEEN